MTDYEKFYFEAGEKLRAVGASFVVSYLFWKLIDSNHNNWRLAKTNNPKVIESNRKYWNVWTNAIRYKSPGYLASNKISLTGLEIIKMAKDLYKILN